MRSNQTWPRYAGALSFSSSRRSGVGALAFVGAGEAFRTSAIIVDELLKTCLGGGVT